MLDYHYLDICKLDYSNQYLPAIINDQKMNIMLDMLAS